MRRTLLFLIATATVLAAAVGAAAMSAATVAPARVAAPVAQTAYAPAKQPVATGFYEGTTVRYLDFGPIKLKPGNKLAPIWTFTNGAAGQRNVIDTVPGERSYTPLWRVRKVTWSIGRTRRVLKSADAVKKAAAVGDVTIVRGQGGAGQRSRPAVRGHQRRRGPAQRHRRHDRARPDGLPAALGDQQGHLEVRYDAAPAHVVCRDPGGRRGGPGHGHEDPPRRQLPARLTSGPRIRCVAAGIGARLRVSPTTTGQPTRKETMTRRNHIKLLAASVLVVTAAAFTGAASAASRPAAAVKVASSSLGRIIVDSHGRTLYLRTRDRGHTSTCSGACARNWPPFTTRGKPRAISGARRALLGTTRRKDGRIQVTYHGHPLYFFAGDRRAGQTRGEGLSAFGGRWYAVSTAGRAVQKRPANAFRYATLTRGVLAIQGTNGRDRLALRVQAGKPGTIQVDVGDNGSPDFSFTRASIARIAVDARAGDDSVRLDERNGVFTDKIPTTIDGGPGNDAITGGSGAETLRGGDGNDSLDGNGGSDAASLGAGDDTFVWDPGDGSDTVEGGDGADTMIFNGADAAERIALSANGNRLRLFRDVGGVTMDTAGVERVDVSALGGADLVSVDDLSGTGVSDVNVDVGGDGQNQVVVAGTNGDDAVNVEGDASTLAVAGLSARVAIQRSERSDELTVNGLGGNDRLSSAALTAQVSLTLDGGAGEDTLTGGQGIETLRGGDGNDSLDGNGGNDLGLLGAGDDTFVWDPGDGSDTVEGQEGADTMIFNGAAGRASPL